MTDALQCSVNDAVMQLSLNRSHCHNAFDDALLQDLHDAVLHANEDASVRVIQLQAEGKHFCAGADLAWMKKMAEYSEEENYQDSLLLAKTMNAFYTSTKPTLAVVHGSAYGGGAGLVAACDIAIAEEDAQFCFSEAKLGLIPAVISPYVVEAIGARASKHLFMTAERFNAHKALQLGLIHHCVHLSELSLFAKGICQQLLHCAPEAVAQSKALVNHVQHKAIDADLQRYTARKIAEKRVSEEGQKGLQAFLQKQPIDWNKES